MPTPADKFTVKDAKQLAADIAEFKALKVKAEGDAAAAAASAASAEAADAAVDASAIKAISDKVDALATTVGKLQEDIVSVSQSKAPSSTPDTSAEGQKSQAPRVNIDAELKLKEAIRANPTNFRIKTALTVQGVGGVYGEFYDKPTIIDGILPLPLVETDVLDYIPIKPAETDVIRGYYETANTTGATWVVDGDAGGSGSIAIGHKEVSVKNVADQFNISDKALEAAEVRDIINARIPNNLRVKRKESILFGVASETTFAGLTAAGNHTAYTPVSSDFDETLQHLGILYDDLNTPPSERILILPTAQFKALTGAKDAMGHPLYYPIGQQPPSRVFKYGDYLIFREKTMPAGKFICVDVANQACSYYMRKECIVETGTAGDDFNKFKSTLRAREEGVLYVHKPHLIFYGTLLS